MGGTAGKKRNTRSADAPEGEPEDPDAGRVNLVVVLGEVSAAPELRELESGRRLAALAIRSRGADGRATSVPVTVWEPAAWVEDLAPGTEVVVVGGVRRRFFRTATGTSATRVDVEAAFIGRAGQRRQLESALRRVETALEALMA